MLTITLTIPGKLPSLNALLAMQHWSRHKFKAELATVFSSALRASENLVSKYHTDLCRYSGLIPSDAPGICKIETSQRKAAKGEEERTEITITYP